MMKPKKNESKQGFLNRCTRQLVKDEGRKTDDAYAACNGIWDESSNARAAMNLAMPLELAAQSEDEKRAFNITAYTGQRIQRYWGDLIIDVSGMKAKKSIPVLREHMRDRVVGHSNKSWHDETRFYLSGEVSNSTPDGVEVAALADEGFPWQASVGIFARRIEVLEDDKATAKVNGQKVKGPLDIWRETLVGEVSFVALGADDNTAAIVLADTDPGPRAVWIGEDINLTTIKGGEEMDITLALLEKETPELLTQIRDAARAEVTVDNFAEQTQTLAQDSTNAERDRIMGIFKEVYGEETAKKFAAVIKPEASMSDMLAFAQEKAKLDVLATLTENAPESLGAGGEEETDATTGPEGEDKWKAEFSKSGKLQAEFGNVDRYVAFKQAEKDGRVRILRSKEN